MRFKRNGDGWCCSDKKVDPVVVLCSDGSLSAESDEAYDCVLLDLDDQDVRIGVKGMVPISINPRGLVCRDQWSE